MDFQNKLKEKKHTPPKSIIILIDKESNCQYVFFSVHETLIYVLQQVLLQSLVNVLFRFLL